MSGCRPPGKTPLIAKTEAETQFVEIALIDPGVNDDFDFKFMDVSKHFGNMFNITTKFLKWSSTVCELIPISVRTLDMIDAIDEENAIALKSKETLLA